MEHDYFDSIALVVYLIVLSLALGQHVTNVGHAIRARNRVSAYWLHSLWACLLFVVQIQLAEHAYGFRCVTDWGSGYVLLFLADALLVYFAVALIFPDLTSPDTSLCLKGHYYSIYRPFFVSISAAVVANYLSTAVMIDNFEISSHDVFLLIFLGLTVLLATTKREIVHEVGSIVGAILFVIFTFLFGSNLSRDVPHSCIQIILDQ
ncbi:MAG: hypothetical protein N838_22310 [Thiohalocapsa sp. PB-PSB1]|jgi:hypothetical protein|nr:MAG: hypothetical protein N838_31615 [Thiohalocapsa sp. PB-PSB1]QQO55672.1 MAG: hypothetical protein N838_22310 [Thiohalocapsa sp. PB-PSB1]